MSAPLIIVQGSILFPSSIHRKDYWGAICIFIMYIEVFSLVSSVAQLHPALCDPMDCSTPDLPVHHQLPKFTQTHVHWVGDANQPSHPLSSPSFPAFNLSQHQGLFKCHLFASGGQSTGVSALASVLPKNIHDGSPLEWTGWISLQSKGISRVFSNTTVQKHLFLVHSLLYGPTLASVHNYCKNHSFD